MKKKSFIYIALIVLGLISVTLNIVLINEKNDAVENLKGEIEYLQLRATADSYLIIDEYDSALTIYAKADSLKPELEMFLYDSTLLAQKKSEHKKPVVINTVKLDNTKGLVTKLKTQNNNQKSTIEELSTNLDSLSSALDGEKANLNYANTHVENLRAELDVALQAYQYTTFFNIDDVEIKYIGRMVNGKAKGYGYAILDRKGFYEGEWRNNEMHGTGIYHWMNGDYYKGDFREGRREGNGTYYFKSGEKYVGEWENNLRHGKGEMIDSKGKILLSGNWEEDKYKKK
ncbi:MORN repeat-containing protein [Sediminitomix flava]|uniref:MORN repeat protein n=1 Tax=Sediminitomix flava TaxID=379075 RepID=A0A315ZDP1_SEDFL|nr:hypothetical protein [Sediminitomix flava]PWJ43253.1 MORN repeat protein [Sediminitomix flava]